MILDEILAHKREEIAAAKAKLPLEELQRRVQGHRAQRSLRHALQSAKTRPALIAELKRKSPSKGMLRERFDPVSLAQQLQDAGAHALSVLTDEKYFGGNLEFLRDVHQFTEIPILRKDFLIDPYQIYEAVYAQADAVLLIVHALSDAQLTELLSLAGQFGLEALVEVHDEAELARALKADAQLIGINTRDLTTFTMHPDITAQLVPKIPPGKTIVAESGIKTSEELQVLRELGVHAVLIGETLMRAPDPAQKLHDLFSGLW